MKDFTLSSNQKSFIRISLTLIVYSWIISNLAYGQGSTFPISASDSVMVPDIHTFEQYFLTPDNTCLALTIVSVFAFRPESIPVFTRAMDQDDSWKTKYYLGLIYWHLHLSEKAMELFEQCGDIPDFAPFYVARAILFQNSEREYCMPCNDYNRAVNLGQKDWRIWHFFINFLQIKGAFQKQLIKSREAYNHFHDNPVIASDYANALKNSKNQEPPNEY